MWWLKEAWFWSQGFQLQDSFKNNYPRRLRAVSLFSWSVEQTPETRKWPRAWPKARARAAALVLTSSPLNARARARALPLLNLKKKRDYSQSITSAFAPHFKSSVWLLEHAIADSFLIESHLFSFPQNVSAVLQKVMAAIWTKEKCLNSHGIYRQAVQVLMTCLKLLAYLINNGWLESNWGLLSFDQTYVLRKNHKPLGRQIIEQP